MELEGFRHFLGSAAWPQAFKCAAAGLSPALTACQTIHNVVPTSCLLWTCFCQRPSGVCFSKLPFSLLTGSGPCRRRANPPPGEQFWENAVAFFITSRCRLCAGTLCPKWGRRRPKVPKKCKKGAQKLTFWSPRRHFWVP